jgi:hypothetical protein
MSLDSTSITTTMRTPLGKGPARPASARATAKAPATTAKRNGEPGKPKTTAKPASRPKPAAKRWGTHGGRLSIAILSGLAIGLVTLLIYNFSGPTKPWVFDSPKAQLPSLQSKHTLY